MDRRNKTPKTPKYCHYKRTDQAYVRLEGRFVYLGKYDSPESHEAYKRTVAEWMMTGGSRQQDEDDSGLTVVELMARFWRHAEKHYCKDGRPTSEQAIIRVAFRHLKELYGSTPVASFTPGCLRIVRQRMISSELSRGNINALVSRIRRMFRWGESRDLIPRGTWESLRTVEGLARGRSEARETDPVRPVLDCDIAAVRPFVSRQVRAMIDLQLLTGMRPGEVVIMRAADIDMSGPVWAYVPSSHKTEHHGRERIIEIGPRGQGIIREFLKPDTAAYLFDPRDAESERHAEAPTHRRRNQKTNRRKTARRLRERYDTSSYRRAIQRACDRADREARRAAGVSADGDRLVPRWFPHQLRHNAATRLRKEFGIDVARAVLGHTSPAVTEIYAEADASKARAAVAAIG